MSHKTKSEASHAPLSYLRTILANAGWLTGTRIAGDFANLVLFVVLARMFGPDGIGQYAYALGIAGLMYAAVNLGLEDYAVRQCARLPAEERGLTIVRLILIQIAALAITGTTLLTFLAIVGGTKIELGLVAILVLQQVVLAIARTLYAPAFGQQRMAGPAVAELSTRLLGICGSLLLVYVFATNLAITLAPLLASSVLFFVFALLSFASECPKTSYKADWLEIKKTIIQVWPFAASLILSYATVRSNFIIINLMLGDTATGIFASGLKLMEAAVIPLSFLGFAAYPRLSSLYSSDRQEFWRTGDELVRVSVIFGMLISWALFFPAPYVVEPLFGERFRESGIVVKYVAGFGLFTSLSFAIARLLLASNRQHARLIVQAIALIVLLIASLTAIPVFGIFGAVIAMYASAISSILSMIWLLGRDFATRIAPIGKLLIAAITAFLFLAIVDDASLTLNIISATISLLLLVAIALLIRPRSRIE